MLGKKIKVKVKKIHEYKRNKEEVSFYKTYKWTQTSKSYRKEHPLCVECAKKGRTKKADVVDHIIPIKEGGLQYDHSNLQSLCHAHHNKKTAQDERNKRRN